MYFQLQRYDLRLVLIHGEFREHPYPPESQPPQISIENQTHSRWSLQVPLLHEGYVLHQQLPLDLDGEFQIFQEM